MLFPSSAMVAEHAPNFLLDAISDNLPLQPHNLQQAHPSMITQAARELCAVLALPSPPVLLCCPSHFVRSFVDSSPHHTATPLLARHLGCLLIWIAQLGLSLTHKLRLAAQCLSQIPSPASAAATAEPATSLERQEHHARFARLLPACLQTTHWSTQAFSAC